MSNDRYERIRAALAMKPTPGPWAAVCHTNSVAFVKNERLAGYFVEVRHCHTAQNVSADASLIAACDPDTIRALLAERDALRHALEAMVEVGFGRAYVMDTARAALKLGEGE